MNNKFLLPRFAAMLPLAAVLMLLASLTRLMLSLRPEVVVGFGERLAAMALGIVYDAAFAVYLLAPCYLLLLSIPERWLQRRWLRLLAWLIAASLVFVLLFVAVAEWVFWDEFAARFNFIAVDYLIYTSEVIGNIRQSYPLGRILAGLGVLALIVTWQLRQRLATGLGQAAVSWRARAVAALLTLLLLAAVTALLSTKGKDRFNSDAANELAGNGPYQFFAAFRANDLDYQQFYRTLPTPEILAGLRNLRGGDTVTWRGPLNGDLAKSLTAVVAPTKPKPRYSHVLLVSVESLGADYVGAWGDQRGLTPFLDELAGRSLRFDRVYATGNRTVRGLEALSVAIPPTPGQSIVKRQDHGNLVTLGGQLKKDGYQPVFVYGGYGYFDNMNAYFAANGYEVIDRNDIAADQKPFANIWGVADEDLYRLALNEVDKRVKSGPVFAHIMTTSNHRPYTYPAGRIDIASGSGREGAVKYSDWAIGFLLRELAKKPWANETLLVITADHGANARGTSEIPVDKYRIPLLMYSPGKTLKPERISRHMSQIDIAPTLLGLLGMAYDSRFFGDDILAPHQVERAFVGNYQTLGYLRDGRLVTLTPRRGVKVVPSPEAPPVSRQPLSEATLINEAITWYQGAFIAYRQGGLRWP